MSVLPFLMAWSACNSRMEGMPDVGEDAPEGRPVKREDKSSRFIELALCTFIAGFILISCFSVIYGMFERLFPVYTGDSTFELSLSSNEGDRSIDETSRSGGDAPSTDSPMAAAVEDERVDTAPIAPVKPEWIAGITLLLIISIACTCLIIGINSSHGKRVPIGAVVAGIVLCCMLWSDVSNLFEASVMFDDSGRASSSAEECIK